MRMVDLILDKRRGKELSEEEIRFMVEGYTKGQIPDYQMSALLMAICFQGMSAGETAALTMCMAASGDTMDLSRIEGVKVDKHSTGGVGDKTSLIVAPLASAAGVPVAKMSGRGLGHTGGTIDKLEAIPGFQVSLDPQRFIEHVNRFGMAIAGQTGNLAPADKKLYALRDVTGTVDSIPLIASSIMSKKIASGADCIVLDVKVGSGAFMKTEDDARQLARTMVDIGCRLGRKTVALLTDMSQPLGHEVGNANEIREVIDVLRGEGPEDLRELSVTLAAQMTVLGGVYQEIGEARAALTELLAGGQALDRFKQFVAAQGGDPSVADQPLKLPQAQVHKELKTTSDGYIGRIDAEAVGVAAMMLGAGRRTKDDTIDHAAGITVLKKIGDQVKAGEAVFVLHSNLEQLEPAERLLLGSIEITPAKPPENPIIRGLIT